MMESHLILLARKRRGPMTAVIDKHKQGLFELRKVRKILQAVGFRYRLYENDFSGGKYKLRGPIFVCVKP